MRTPNLKWASVLLSLSVALRSFAQTPADPAPLYVGLPPKIPADFLERNGFLRIQELSDEDSRRLRNSKNYAPAPIGTDFLFDGGAVNVNDRASQHKVFSESMHGMIPEGTQIVVSQGSNGREVWDYPVGTSVVHLIRLNDPSSTIFELRLVRKLGPDHWAFGSYSPVAGDSDHLTLNTYEGWPVVSFPVSVAQGPSTGKVVNVQLKKIKLNTCQGCHFSNSTADYQYAKFKPDGKVDYFASVAVTGPCGFVPPNSNVRTQWADAFKNAHDGASPFVMADSAARDPAQQSKKKTKK